MKFCVIASGDYFSSYGGGQIYVKNLVRSLKVRGYDVSVISLSVEFIAQLFFLNVPKNIIVHCLTYSFTHLKEYFLHLHCINKFKR